MQQDDQRYSHKALSQGLPAREGQEEYQRHKSQSQQDCKFFFEVYKLKLSPTQLAQAVSDEVPEFDSFQQMQTLSTDYKEQYSKTPQTQSRMLHVPKQLKMTMELGQKKEYKLTDKELFVPFSEVECIQIRKSDNKKVDLPLILMKNGGNYTGQWYNRKPHGIGTYQFPDQSAYSGEWVEGFANGKGEFQDPEGGIYRGDFVQNCIQGKGIYQYADKSIYDGQWFQDKYHGSGIETKPQTIYKGMVVQLSKGKFAFGKREGQGILMFSNNEKYEGQFSNDLFQGKGLYSWPDGRQYNGEWRNGMMHGYGVLQYPDGRMYAGYYVKDQKEGVGTFQYSDGRKYIGNWMKGLQHGSGEFRDQQGNIKKGVWRDGKLFNWEQ